MEAHLSGEVWDKKILAYKVGMYQPLEYETSSWVKMLCRQALEC